MNANSRYETAQGFHHPSEPIFLSKVASPRLIFGYSKHFQGYFNPSWKSYQTSGREGRKKSPHLCLRHWCRRMNTDAHGYIKNILICRGGPACPHAFPAPSIFGVGMCPTRPPGYSFLRNEASPPAPLQMQIHIWRGENLAWRPATPGPLPSPRSLSQGERGAPPQPRLLAR